MNRRTGALGRTIAAAFLTSLLAACGSSGDDISQQDQDHDDHDHPHIETAGRLAIIEDQSRSVRIYDLDDKSVAQTFLMTNPPSAIAASPGKRYALVIQRTQDLVELIDGGIWQEDHGDHLHDYKEAPKRLDFSIDGVRPTHYETHDGIGAIFMDGLDTTGQKAAVVTLTDAGIGAARHEAAMELPLPMHGTAEPRGDYLLTTYRDPESAGTLPQQVELYRRDGASYRFVKRFDELCPSLHGSYSNRNHSAFGCADGVLVVTQAGDEFTATKIDNPPGLDAAVRIGTVAGHDHLDSFVGIASPGLLFEIDPQAGRITQIEWADGRTRRAHGFDADGKHFLVLDDRGALHVLDATRGWALKTSLAAIASMPGASPYPSIAAGASAHTVYVSDPEGRQIAVVDLEKSAVTERLALDFKPAGLTWLGTPAHEH